MAGAVILFPDEDVAINREHAAFQDRLSEWEYAGVELAELVRTLRVCSQKLWKRFVSSGDLGAPFELPPVLFRFAWEHPSILGHYQPDRNDLGLRWEISANPRHLLESVDFDVAATELHELLHLLEDLRCRKGLQKRVGNVNGYHSGWFRAAARKLGIPCTTFGHQLAVINASPVGHKRRVLPGAQSLRALHGRDRPMTTNRPSPTDGQVQSVR